MVSISVRAAAVAALFLCATNAAAQTCGPVTLLEDAAGDWDGTFGAAAGAGAGLPEQDILGLTLEQTTVAGETLLTFRILTAATPAASPPPNAAWFTSFESPDGVVFGVRLQTDPAGGESYFSYIASPSNAGNIDGRFVTAGSEKPAEAGEFTGDGVAITVKASNVGIFEAGQTLGPFNAASVQSVPEGVVAATVDEAPQGLGRDGFFDICGGRNGIAGLGTVPLALLLPLLLAGLARATRR